MRRKLLFVIFLINLLGINAQQIKRYKNELGYKIEIADSIFYYIENHGTYPYWYNDTLAMCSIKQINNEFIELNSLNPIEAIKPGYNISEESIFNNNIDSIEICFQIPYDRGILNISIFLENTFPVKIYEFPFNQSNNRIRIPMTAKEFTYSIMPDEENAVIHNSWGMNYGVLFISSGIILLGENTNRVNISIPSLTNSFFEKYYLKGDYARIIGDTIIWKGCTFVKQNSMK